MVTHKSNESQAINSQLFYTTRGIFYRSGAGSVWHDKFAIMESIYTSMKLLDIDGYDSEMYGFNLVNDSSTLVEEINESADSYINILNWIIDDLEALKSESEKYDEEFTGEEVDQLNEIISGLKASAENQIGVLSNFTKVRIDTGITLEEYLEEAKDEYAEAEQAVTELEGELEVEYVDDSE